MNQESLLRIAEFTPKSIQSPNAWVGHLHFAAWVIQEVSPKIFVELGTHTGNSYFSFCQSVLEQGLSTKAYAVDTWQGDVHAGQYGDDIYAEVNAHNQEHYASMSRLMRMTFDDALSYFADHSIDLLHIDGLHTYEAVRHDFETWLPKLAPGAIVLFHDTNVRERDFGVWQLWEELQVKYKHNLEFVHSNGLGVLQINDPQNQRTLPWLGAAARDKTQLISYFAALGARELERYELNLVYKPLSKIIVERDAQIASLSKQVAESEERINAMLASRLWRMTRSVRDLVQWVAGKWAPSQWGRSVTKFRTNNLFRVRAVLSRYLPAPVKRVLRRSIELVRQKHLANIVVPKLNVLGDFNLVAQDRKTVLIVSHEGSRTGAPILSYNLAKTLLKEYNVVALFLGPGPLLKACHADGAIVVGPMMNQSSELLADLAIKQIMAAVNIDFALINSIESRRVLPALAKYRVATVSLIHEFATYTRPRGAFSDAVSWSGKVVFSTAITRDSMIAEYPHLSEGIYPVIPQGRSTLPDDGEPGVQGSTEEASRIRQFMRPEGFPTDGIVVLGAGVVQYRKGVDLFIDCAAHILRKTPDLAFRFVWVGKGFDPEDDVFNSVYLADQIRRAGLENHVYFMDEVTLLDAVYAAADILLLSSRLDPLPNVAIDALATGVPVVCFDQSSGVADILSQHGLGASCVADYLDTEDMANKVIALAQSTALRTEVAARSAQMAAEVFDMAAYVKQIELLALNEVDHLRQAALDIDTIATCDLLQLDYYRPPHLSHQDRAEAIKTYLRSWASNEGRRKPFPGFHPGIYREQHGVEPANADPLADYLRASQPQGAWNLECLTPADEAKPLPPELRVGLHIHAYYPALVPEILERLNRNRVRPDLLVSVTSESARQEVLAHTAVYEGGAVDIRVVPNRGRDIGPFLTEFGDAWLNQYDLVGHLHTKKTVSLKDASTGKDWYRFLLENLLGGQEAAMADIILGKMADADDVSMVFPDDPYIVGWGNNFSFAEPLLADLGIDGAHRAFYFPVGTMFWARPSAFKALLDLKLGWADYPAEPLPYDGSLLHALERIFGLLAVQNDQKILLTNVPGVKR